MSKMKNKNNYILGGALVVLVIFLFLIPALNKRNNKKEEDQSVSEPINGMIMLIEFDKIEGILQWEKELDSRGLNALLQVQEQVLSENPEVFKRLASKGYEVAGIYGDEPFWDMPYEEQYKHMKDSKDLVESIIAKDIKVFGSKYFAYDENTLKAADALGIDYILGRGIHDVEAVVYQPEEYSTKVISVSNVDVGEMGRGSLCDYSLWARGSGADEFGQMLDESVAKKPTNMILVSHAYLGGTRAEWWQEYERALSLDNVSWSGFSDWMNAQVVVNKPNAEIEINNEVKYTAPKPEKEIDEYEAISGIEISDENSESLISGDEMMCQ